MRKCFLNVVVILILLASCGKNAPTWQEQYDLGVRYLSEGNYEEALIAFTAAIEIDPKQAPAYVGRGDTYAGIATLDAEKEIDASANWHHAEQDYLYAIELDETLADVYGKLADIYIAMGDQEAAIAILELGAKTINDKKLQSKLENLRVDRPEGASEIVEVNGYIIDNPEEYEETWRPYIDLYQNDENNIRCSIDSYGIRFSEDVHIKIGEKSVQISEACLAFDYESGIINEQIQLYDHETRSNGPLVNLPIRATGYFYENEQKEELKGPVSRENDGEIYTYYEYRPNGDYIFFLTGYEELP